MKQETCEERINKHLKDRLEDLRTLLNAEDNETEELGSLNDYGLCVDYVEPGTFEDQKEGYIRYQLSWGGPSDEFRFFINPDGSIHRIEYWFLDWFDGAHRVLNGEDYDLLANIYEFGYFQGTLEKHQNAQ